MLCAIYSNWTTQQCQKCHIIVEDLKNSKLYEARTIDETGNTFNYYEAIISEAIELLLSRPSTARASKEEEKKKLEVFLGHSIMPILSDRRCHTLSRYLLVP